MTTKQSVNRLVILRTYFKSIYQQIIEVVNDLKNKEIDIKFLLNILNNLEGCDIMMDSAISDIEKSEVYAKEKEENYF